jgi:hypothetical protein
MQDDEYKLVEHGKGIWGTRNLWWYIITILKKGIYMNNIRSCQVMSSGWNKKRKVYAQERQHDETHKVYKLLDQNNDTPFYFHYNPERHK